MNEFLTPHPASNACGCAVAEFRTSSYSGAAGECVEVARTPTAALIRDTQNRRAGHLPVAPREWVALLRAC